MFQHTKYYFIRDGNWRLWVLPDRWSRELWGEIVDRIGDQIPAERPRTLRFSFTSGDEENDFYLKIFGRPDLLGSLKDLVRHSKALRALRQGEAFSRCGFHVPLAVAAGEERTLGVLKRAFLLTRGISGSALPYFLREYYASPLDPGRVRRKRKYIRQLALEVRRLHEIGFVHGDLVPYNILVHAQGGQPSFFYLDHDRTQRYPNWFPQAFWKRNLVQLNRFVLPGISLQDRIRFLRHYLGVDDQPWGKKQKRLARWLEQKTRKRRAEYVPGGADLSFRKLMRWDESSTKNTEY
ncbi:MAG: hypothetical protein HYY46_16120 [Deltaproteobacteria bacterium]|nr:hypothetical protein [Deltaproteobacteria bacterium]